MLKQQDLDRLLNPAEAALYKGISPNLFRFYVDSGRGPKAYKVGRRREFLLYLPEDLDAWDYREMRKPTGRKKNP